MEREAIEEEEILSRKREMLESAKQAAETAVPQERYEAAKEAAKRFDEMWNQPGRDRKAILAFLLRRTASWIESSFLSTAWSEGLSGPPRTSQARCSVGSKERQAQRKWRSSRPICAIAAPGSLLITCTGWRRR